MKEFVVATIVLMTIFYYAISFGALLIYLKHKTFEIRYWIVCGWGSVTVIYWVVFGHIFSLFL
jgi:hypothetical protein